MKFKPQHTIALLLLSILLFYVPAWAGTYGVTHTVTYLAWDNSANAPETGDGTNHTLRWIKDGTSSAPTNSPAEVDATNAPGIYKLVLTATECECLYGTLAGKSSTANVTITPVSIDFVHVPNAAPGGNGGLPTVDASNHVAGVVATLDVNISQISSDSTAADNLEAVLDGTGAAVTLDTAVDLRTNLATINTNVLSNASSLTTIGTYTDTVETSLGTIDTEVGNIQTSLNTIAGAGFAAGTDTLEAIADALAVVDGNVDTAVANVDGETLAKFRELLLAYVAGTTDDADNGDGTHTLTYYKQDGTTELLDVTYNATGEHTATDIDP